MTLSMLVSGMIRSMLFLINGIKMDIDVSEYFHRGLQHSQYYGGILSNLLQFVAML